MPYLYQHTTLKDGAHFSATRVRRSTRAAAIGVTLPLTKHLGLTQRFRQETAIDSIIFAAKEARHYHVEYLRQTASAATKLGNMQGATVIPAPYRSAGLATRSNSDNS